MASDAVSEPVDPSGPEGAGSPPRDRAALEDAAGRISAYVYGNILVLAALIALQPDDLDGPKGVGYVLGTAVSTFIAHLFAETSAQRVRLDRPLTWEELRHEARHAAPIASTAATPTLLMIGALAGWWPTTVALVLSIAVTIGRLVALGWVVGRLSRRRVSRRPFVSGLLLAAVCLLVAVLKWWLTH
ncbi:hypothetical protein [Arthrobacter sp. Ld5]|uniref:hypothetical protein n=1 Tax=Arthrobacter sp. Ld5 TaxID=649152 RepID=UPI003EB8AC9D